MSKVDFSKLVKPAMIETLDFETLLAERKAALLALFDSEQRESVAETLQRESEPLTKLLQENCYRELILRNRINQAAYAVLLAYASGSDLDAVAANYNVSRNVISPATRDTAAVYESDSALRERVQLAFDALSVAGPVAAYRYHALSADGRVSDVSVISPSPAVVTVSILQADSEQNKASSELVAIVNQALNAEDVRPIADRVTVQAASIVPYQIVADIYIGKDPEGAMLLENIQSNVRNYVGQRKRIGQSVRLSALYAQMHIEGVSRVVIKQPATDIAISMEQAGYCTAMNIQIAGVE